VANPIVRSLATIFMLRCDRDIGHAHLLTAVTTKIDVVEPGQLGRVSMTAISFTEAEGKVTASLGESLGYRHSVKMGI